MISGIQRSVVVSFDHEVVKLVLWICGKCERGHVRACVRDVHTVM